MLELGYGGNHRSMATKSGGLYLLTRKGCNVQVGQIDDAAMRFSTLVYLFIVSGPDVRKLYVCKGPHNYVLYPLKDKT